MISSLRGTVTAVAPGSVVIDVHGVGYAVAVTPHHARSLRLDHEVLILTTLIVREDAFVLFGFADAEQRDLFELLRGVSGVGPKSALAVLGALSVSDVATAIEQQDDAPFRRVSGIGPKTARLIIVSLAGKLVAPATPQSRRIPSAAETTVLAALIGLGWSEQAAKDAVSLAAPGVDDASSLLRSALESLGRTE